MIPKDKMQLLEMHVRGILECLGEDPNRDGLKDTPRRVARLYDDVLDGRFCAPPVMTSFKDENYGGVVNVHHFPFYSFCEHHLVPFQGHAAVAYIPNELTVGLSKLVRAFRYHCKRVTIQERLTRDALDTIVAATQPKGAIVWAQAEHLCMSLRGVKAPGAKTTTTAYYGVFETDIQLREQFLREACQS
jgi:GTP cyclohydrolase I